MTQFTKQTHSKSYLVDGQPGLLVMSQIQFRLIMEWIVLERIYNVPNAQKEAAKVYVL
jgi:hypothetical protein